MTAKLGTAMDEGGLPVPLKINESLCVALS
jgi:hypothetical protein